MRRAFACFAAALAVAPGAALAACPAGKRLYARGGVRLVDVHVPEHDAGFDPTFFHRIVGCAGGARWTVYEASPYNDWRMYGLRRIGTRIGFVTHDVGWDNGFYTEVGWTDVRTHRTRVGLINAGEDGEADDPYVPDDRVSYAIAGDGAMAVLGGKPTEEQEVALLEPRGRRRAFARARILMDATGGGFVHGSLRIGPHVVSWARLDGSRLEFDRT